MTCNISITKDFGVYEIGFPEDVKAFIDKIDVKGEKKVVLNICNCLPDYHGTSMIIDAITKQLLQLGEPRKLHVVTNLRGLNETNLIDLIFKGSSELGFHSNTAKDDLVNTLRTCASAKKIEIKILCEQKDKTYVTIFNSQHE
jgi:hypothetical protein